MRRVADEADQPGARAIASQLRPGGVRVLLTEAVAISAGHVAHHERPALLDDFSIRLVRDGLRFEPGLGREGDDHFLDVVRLFRRGVLLHPLGHLTVLELRASKVVLAIHARRVEQAGQPLPAGKALEVRAPWAHLGDDLVLRLERAGEGRVQLAQRGDRHEPKLGDAFPGLVGANRVGGQRLVAQAVVPVEPVAARAVLGEELGALRVSVVAQERCRARGRDAALGDELVHAFGVAVRLLLGRQVGFILAVLHRRHAAEDAGRCQQRAQEQDVEPVAMSPLGDKRHQRHHRADQAGDHDGSPDFRATREVFEELEKEEHEPLRPRGAVLLGRIRRRAQMHARHGGGVLPIREQHKPQQHQEHRQAGGGVLQELSREILLIRAGAVLGHIAQAMFAVQVVVEPQQAGDAERQQAGVQRQKVRQRVVSHGGPAHGELLQHRPNHRRHAHDANRHPRGPITMLIVGQQPAGCRHGDGQRQQQHHDPEVHLPRRAVDAVDHHLQQVQHQHHHERLRAKMMQPPQDPPARHLALDVMNALPRRLRAGAVAGPQEKPRDGLQQEHIDHQGAPHVTPARPARQVLEQARLGEAAQSRAFVQPSQNALHHAMGIFSVMPSWKSWNRTHTSVLLRTSTSSVSRRRGLGLCSSLSEPSFLKKLL